jgi:hypothetical protein
VLLVAFALAQAAPFDTSADYLALAKEHCRREWPADFQMQEHCFGGQVRGMAQFKAVSDDLGKAIEPALETCAEEWTRERLPDWQMIGHCAVTQAEAFRRLRP